MNDQSNNRIKSENEPVNTLHEAVGGVLGNVVSLLVPGPTGIILSGASGPLFTNFLKVATEFLRRRLGPGEEKRICKNLMFAAEKIQENIANGQQIRQDEFFQEQPNERAAFEEILEGVLLAAQGEPQERKLQFYGYLVANIAFRPDIDRSQANLLIRLTESMSYRQMCLLTLFSTKERFNLRREDYQNFRELGEARVALLQEIYDLCIQRILESPFGGLRVGQSIPRLEYLNPGEVSVQSTGVTLYNLTELWRVDSQDLEKIAVLLSDSKLPPPLPLGPSLSPKPYKPVDTEYLDGLASTLGEWASEADEVAYRDL